MKYWDDDRTLEQVLATPCQWDAILENRAKRVTPSTAQVVAELKMREAEDAAAIRQRESDSMHGAKQWHLRQIEQLDRRVMRMRTDPQIKCSAEEFEEIELWRQAELRCAAEAELGTLESVLDVFRAP